VQVALRLVKSEADLNSAAGLAVFDSVAKQVINNVLVLGPVTEEVLNGRIGTDLILDLALNLVFLDLEEKGLHELVNFTPQLVGVDPNHLREESLIFNL
jgi:hypothetical protein